MFYNIFLALVSTPLSPSALASPLLEEEDLLSETEMVKAFESLEEVIDVQEVEFDDANDEND